MENRKVEGLISYSFEQQIVKFKVNLEETKNYGELMLILHQIKTNGQSMVF